MKLRNPFTQAGEWYKANLHTHSTTSDGRQSPAETAEAYRKAGMPTEAAQRFRQVIKTFPGTAQAEKARTLLADVEASLQNAYNKGGGRQR